MENNCMKAYTLEEISKWHAKEGSSIQLPSLQRGFVWRPHQIENLWDSILRGYPIGAILMSVDENENRFLLDGQQRCTSIALGFFDPFNSSNKEQIFSLKDYLPSVWIDLKPNNSNGNKFLIRVLTKSHPWGYQMQREKNGTGKTLSMSDRRNALKYFASKEPETNYINLSSSIINPWDAHYPVPLSLLLSLNSSKFESFTSELKEKVKTLKFQTKFSAGKDVDFENVSDVDLNVVYKGVKNAKALLIPEIMVNSNLLKEDDEQLSDNSQDPTLFVRLNSAGTDISGEELIYSIYKATFPDIKESVEKNFGAGFIAPSKIVNLIARLVYCEIREFQNFPSNFNVNSFRKEIKDPIFRSQIKSYIDTNEASKLIERAISILNQTNSHVDELGVPIILIKQFIVSSPDLFLVLLLFIKHHNLHKGDLTENQIKDISASYVQLLWFSNDIGKTPSLLFNQLKSKMIWGDAVNDMINNNQVVPLVKSKLVRENLVNIVVNNKLAFGDFDEIKKRDLLCTEIKEQLMGHEIDDNLNSEEFELLKSRWWSLIERIFRNRALLIYAQRQYFNQKFKEFNQFENIIDDTNKPWDWDHIYPNSWVYRKEGVDKLVRHWVNSIGNFRALSYDDNRSENNHYSPAERLKDDTKKRDSFILENDYEFFKELTNQSWRIKGESAELTNFLGAVVNRMVNIYEEWYNTYYFKG